jgi:glycosyltransferase involved in cell wall biosynthesis
VLAISVALCTYNGERYLAEQLASIAAQTRPPAELVVTDDASSDATLSILESFAATAPFAVRLYRHADNRGSTQSFEETIAACAAPLIALCDQDDVWRPQKLEHLATALECDAAAGYAFSDAAVVDAMLRPMGVQMWDTVGLADGAWQDFRGTRQFEMLLERTRVTGATMMIRADYLALCRPFPQGVVHDRWLATMLSGVGAFGVAINETLVDYRQHAAQQIGIARRRRGSLRVQASRDFVLKQRRRMHAELAFGRHFIGNLDDLLSKSGALDDVQTRHARRSRALASKQVEHVAARAALDDMPAAAIGVTITRELMSGGYHRYSGGVRAALADLWYCLRYRSTPVPGGAGRRQAR